jgi:GntR family transcriptional regulator
MDTRDGRDHTGHEPAAGGDARPRAERARNLADVLRYQITVGAFGDNLLPDEQTLSRQLGASRNAVREALGLLRQKD